MLSLFIFAGFSTRDEEANQTLLEVSNKVRAAREAENQSYVLASKLYTEALLRSEEILSKSPLSQAAQALANGQTLNGNITLSTLRDIIPSVKQKADAEADPLICILLLAEKKADLAYRYYAINRVVRRLFKEGRYDRAVAAILKGGRGSDKADLYLKLASLTEEADQRERTRDLLENAYQAQREESWEPANILANVAEVQFRIGNAGRALSILTEAENRLPFIDVPYLKARALTQIAIVYQKAGIFGKADTFFAAAVQVTKYAEENKSANLIGSFWQETAVALAHAGRYDEGSKLIKNIDDSWQRNWGLIALARVARERYEPDRAQDFLQEALELVTVFNPGKDDFRKSDQILDIAKIYLDLRLPHNAVSALRLLSDDPERRWHRREKGKLLLEASQQFWNIGDKTQAFSLLEEAHEETKIYGEALLIDVAMTYLSYNDREKALRYLDNVFEAAEEISGKNATQASNLFLALERAYKQVGLPEKQVIALKKALKAAKNTAPDWGMTIQLGEVAFAVAENDSLEENQKLSIMHDIVEELDNIKDFGA